MKKAIVAALALLMTISARPMSEDGFFRRLDQTITVKAGEQADGVLAPAGAVAAVAVSDGQANRQVGIADGKLSFNAGIHDWTIIFAGTAGQTGIIERFKDAKGYDPTPYAASFFAPTRTENEKRVLADCRAFRAALAAGDTRCDKPIPLHWEGGDEGRPGARVAVYRPTLSVWLGNEACLDDLAGISEELQRHQVDFGYVDDGDFGGTLTVGPGYLEGKDGEKFHTLVIPPADVMSEKAWSLVGEFVELGGKLLFWGSRPSGLAGRSFTEMKGFPDCPKAVYEPQLQWTAQVEAAMPVPELKILSGQPQGDIIYTRRILEDSDALYFFNDGRKARKVTLSIDAAGKVFEKDSRNGEDREIASGIEDDRTVVTLEVKGGMGRTIFVKKDNKTFNVKDFGAKGDGTAKDTEAIQAASDAAYANGGGVVVIPAGDYLSGALFFRNGVDLEIQEGATLISTVDSDDFPQIPTRFEGIERKWRSAFLNFDHSRNVRVYGKGSICGRGQEWRTNKNKDGHWGRPRMICFTDCPGGSISGLTMRDHASWCLHVLYTDGFTIDNLHISVSSYVPSSDGVDIDSSSNIDMHDVYTYVTDDCLSIKSGKNEDGRRVARPSMNIHVWNCNFDGGHGVAMGSEISGCIRNVLIEDCVCGEDNQAPVRFKSQPSRGGVVEDITFKNMTLDNSGTFISANMIWRMVEDYPEYTPRTVLRNIRVINVSGTAKSVGSIIGDPAAPIPEGTFKFEGCRMTVQKGLNLANVDQQNFEGLEITAPEGVEAITRRAVSVGGKSSGTAIKK